MLALNGVSGGKGKRLERMGESSGPDVVSRLLPREGPRDSLLPAWGKACKALGRPRLLFPEVPALPLPIERATPNSMSTKRIPLPSAILASCTLGLAPFVPEPHIVGKLRWLAGGGVGMQAMDYFDLVLHGAPWVLLLVALLQAAQAKFSRGSRTGAGA